MFPLLIGMALLQRLAYQFKDLVVKAQLTEHLHELLLEGILAHKCEFASLAASSFVVCTVVVYVFAFLHFSDNGTSTIGAGQELRE